MYKRSGRRRPGRKSSRRKAWKKGRGRKKGTSLAKKAIRMVRKVARATRPEKKYTDSVSSSAADADPVLNPDEHPEGTLVHHENAFEYIGTQPIGAPIPASFGQLGMGSVFQTRLIPSIATGGGDHMRIGDEITPQWFNFRFVAGSARSYREGPTVYPARWDTSTGPTSQLTVVDTAMTFPGTPTGTLLVMIVERKTGAQQPTYGVNGDPVGYTLGPSPNLTMFFENMDETGDQYPLPYYFNPISMWVKRPSNEVPLGFKVLFSKKYTLGHNNVEDKIFIPYKRRLEMLPSNAPGANNQSLNNQVFLMITHDFGLTPKQAASSTSAADFAIPFMYHNRFVYHDQ